MQDQIQELLDRVDFETFYRSKVEKAKRSGHQLQALCPFHEDKVRSFSANLENGLWKCFACGTEGNIFQFIEKDGGVDFPEAVKRLRDFMGIPGDSDPRSRNEKVKDIRPRIEPTLSGKYHAILLKNKKALAWLQEKRKFSLETIKTFKLGWNGTRYIIPIYDEAGVLRNLRQYSSTQKPKLISWLAKKHTYGEGRIYGLDEMKARPGETVHLLEGEPDKILASQDGFLAVTGTVGAGTWKEEWTPYFKGRDVVIIYDTDEGGQKGAENAARNLVGVASSVKVVKLPLPGTKQKKDYSDYRLGGQRVKDIKKIIKDTPLYVAPSPKQESQEKLEGKVDEVVHKTLTLISGLVHLVRDENQVKYLTLREGKLAIQKELQIRSRVFLKKEKRWGIRVTICRPFQKTPYKLPEAKVRDEPLKLDLKNLLGEVILFIKDYVEMPSESDYLVLSLWVLHSYLMEHFDMTPIIYFYGVFETGKTRAGEVLAEIGFRTERITAPTEATLFRAADFLKTGVVIDEIKLWGQEGNMEVARLIRTRYKRGLSVPRINLLNKGEDQLEYFDVFGPTIVCTDEKCPEGLESRSIIFIMAMNINERVEGKIDEERAQKLRNKLTIFRAKYMEKGLEEQEPVARRRLNEIMMPLYRVLMLMDPGRKEEFKMIVEEFQTEKREEQKDTLEADLVKEVSDYYLETQDPFILTKDLTERMNEGRPENRQFSPVSVGIRMKRLRFKPTREPRTGSKAWMINAKLLKRLRAQFDIEEGEKPQKELFGSTEE